MATFAGQMQQSAGAAAGRLTSGGFTGAEQIALLTELQGITDGGFVVAIDGVQRTMAPTDFTGVGSNAAAAALISSALTTWATCTWSGGGTATFVITSRSTGVASTVGFATAPSSGTNLIATLRLTSALGAQSTPGSASALAAQWVRCDGRHIRPRGRTGARTNGDYLRRVGRFGGGFGIQPWHLRVPRDRIGGNWFVSIQDNATETTLPPSTPTAMRPPAGVN